MKNKYYIKNSQFIVKSDLLSIQIPIKNILYVNYIQKADRPYIKITTDSKICCDLQIDLNQKDKILNMIQEQRTKELLSILKNN